MTLLEPLLAPLSGDDYALLLPDARIGGEVDRAHATRAPGGPPGVIVTSSEAGTISIGGVTTTLAADVSVRVPASPGTHVFRHEGVRSTIGVVVVPPAGEAELELDPARRSARVVSIAPR